MPELSHLPQDPHTQFVLGLALFALFLFTRKNLPLETSSLIILTILSCVFELFPYAKDGEVIKAMDFFYGFGHEALVAVCALMVAGQGIVRTGGLEPIGRALSLLWKTNPTLSMISTLLIAAAISAFVNNVPVVILLLPILISVSINTGSKVSGMLMPMGFATIIGGTCTTIGTSTNLLVVSVAANMGLQRMEMFDFLLPATIAGSVGLLYLWLVVPRFIPDRGIDLSDTSPRIFTAHLALLQDSPVVGKTLSEALAKAGEKIRITNIRRGNDTVVMPLPSLILHADDQLILRDTPEKIKELEKLFKGTLYQGKTGENSGEDNSPFSAGDQQIAEIAVIQGSYLQGRTLSGLRFVERFGLIVLAIHRAGKSLSKDIEKIGDIRLMSGDILLVQGPRDQITKLKQLKDFLVLDATIDLPYTKKAPLAMLIMVAIIVTTATEILPIAVSATTGALIMIMTGCLNWRDATRALSVQVVFLVVASLALGQALLKTGGAAYLAELMLQFSGHVSPAVMLSATMLLMAILTNLVSNNATAVIGTPIAVSIATQMGQPAEPFVLAVLFGANLSFATPMAYKTNLLVMNAGRYTFNDFLRIGIPLVLIIWIVLSVVIPIIYGI